MSFGRHPVPRVEQRTSAKCAYLVLRSRSELGYLVLRTRLETRSSRGVDQVGLGTSFSVEV